MFIFHEISRHKVTSLIFTILLIFIGFVLKQFSPYDLLVEIVTAILNVLQHPSQLAAEASEIHKSLEGIVNSVTISTIIAVEIFIVVCGIIGLFLSSLSHQISDHDKKFSVFQNKLDDFEKKGSAIIPYSENPKRAFFHANIFDFYDRETYSATLQYDKTVDILNHISYQNLLLSPSYLRYLFDRKNFSNNAHKIVVISIIDEGLCAYISICKLIGYQVHIIQKQLFDEVLLEFEKLKSIKIRNMIEGHPYFTQDSRGYTGKYEGLENGRTKDINIDGDTIEKIWPFLDKVIGKFSDKIEDIETISKRSIEKILKSQERIQTKLV